MLNWLRLILLSNSGGNAAPFTGLWEKYIGSHAAELYCFDAEDFNGDAKYLFLPQQMFSVVVFLTSCLLSVTFVFGQRIQLYFHKIILPFSNIWKKDKGKYKHGLVAWLLTFTWIICTLLETGYFSVDKCFLIILVIQFSIAKAFSSWIFDTWFSTCS